MTVTSTANASREMLALMRGAWPTLATLDVPGTAFNPPADTVAWARWRLQHNTAGQSSLGGDSGKRKFERGGNIIVQLFTPLNSGVIGLYDLADTIVNAYEGKRTPGDVWFRNVRVNEIGNAADISGDRTDNWKQTNIIIDFVYEVYK